MKYMWQKGHKTYEYPTNGGRKHGNSQQNFISTINPALRACPRVIRMPYQTYL